MYRLIVVVIVSLALAACNNPFSDVKKTVIPKDEASLKVTMESIAEKLDPEDKRLLATYIVRTKLAEAFGRKNIEDNITVGQAIQNQRAFEELQKQKQAEQEALKLKMENEKLALKKKVDSILTVTILSKEYVPSNAQAGRYKDLVELKLGFQNKSDKKIIGVKGITKFVDIFGDTIKLINLSYDDTIPANGTSTFIGTVDVNNFINADMKFANVEKGKYTFEFEPLMIIFDGGEKLTLTN